MNLQPVIVLGSIKLPQTTPNYPKPSKLPQTTIGKIKYTIKVQLDIYCICIHIQKTIKYGQLGPKTSRPRTTRPIKKLAQNNSVVPISNRTLGFVKRNIKTKKKQEILTIAYNTLVRPEVEYASAVWSPYMK